MRTFFILPHGLNENNPIDDGGDENKRSGEGPPKTTGLTFDIASYCSHHFPLPAPFPPSEGLSHYNIDAVTQSIYSISCR